MKIFLPVFVAVLAAGIGIYCFVRWQRAKDEAEKSHGTAIRRKQRHRELCAQTQIV
jgi:hypothetical protein